MDVDDRDVRYASSLICRRAKRSSPSRALALERISLVPRHVSAATTRIDSTASEGPTTGQSSCTRASALFRGGTPTQRRDRFTLDLTPVPAGSEARRYRRLARTVRLARANGRRGAPMDRWRTFSAHGRSVVLSAAAVRALQWSHISTWIGTLWTHATANGATRDSYPSLGLFGVVRLSHAQSQCHGRDPAPPPEPYDFCVGGDRRSRRSLQHPSATRHRA
jgi:hypothetical protein